MKNENIIANIERYIKTLGTEEQKIYNKAFDYTLTESKKMAEALSLFGLACIVQELKKEIKEATQKATKGNSYVKRSKLITKLLSKSYRDMFSKGFYEDMNGEKMQCCIIDGFYAFMFREALDIPTNEKSEYSVKKMIPDYKNFESCKVDIAEAKTALKLHKAKKDKTRHFTNINNKWYDTEYLINVIDGLGGDIKHYQSDSKVTPDVFESENGLAILCPVRPPQN